jgi:hypothetical protein
VGKVWCAPLLQLWSLGTLFLCVALSLAAGCGGSGSSAQTHLPVADAIYYDGNVETMNPAQRLRRRWRSQAARLPRLAPTARYSPIEAHTPW